jgi:hypothetical protein
MSSLLAETNPPPPPETTNIDASLIERARRTSKVAWHDPTSDWVYVSNNDKRPTFPEGNAVLNMKEYRKVRTARAEGKLSDSELYDKQMFGMYNAKDGWQDYAVKYHDEVIKPRIAGIMNLPDYTGIEVTSVLSTILGIEERAFVLQDAIRVINSPTIETNIDTWTGWDVQENLNIGDDIFTNSGTFARTNIIMTFDAAHIAMYDALNYKPHYHDIWRTNLENIGRRMIRSHARKIGTLLETSTVTAGGSDWGAYTTDHSTANPYAQIGLAADEIVANDGNPSRIAMHDKVFRTMAANTNVKGLGGQGPNSTTSPGTAKTVAGGILPPGYTAYVDNLLTSTVAIVYDPDAFVWVQGPTGTAQYRDVPHMADGYIAFDFNKEKLIQSGKTRKLTAVAT